MKFPVKRFKSLEIALKELEKYIRDGEHLQTGKPSKNFDGLRSREILANWLICAVANEVHGKKFSFTSDPSGGDGIIVNSETEETWATEHVLVPKLPPCEDKAPAKSIEDKILDAIQAKNDKGGAAYASGKTLVVFLNSGGGEWYPNKVAKRLPSELHFDEVYIVGLHHVDDEGQYIYFVTQLSKGEETAPAWQIAIGNDFETWVCTRVQ